MATITKRNKSYLFRVYAGYDITGKQIVKSKTWTPPADWSEKRAEKEATVQAALFEDQVRNGIAGNGKMRFSDFAELWFTQYAEKQLRPRTVARYRELLVRIDLALGHLSLEKIRPVNLLEFYGSLANAEPSNATYCCRMDLRKILKERSITQAEFSKTHDVSLTTLSTAWHQQPISRKSAEKICAGLDVPLNDYFSPSDPGLCLSPTTVRHYHSLISDILGDAVRWQYIPFSPCDRIDPPKVASPDILYLDDAQTRQLVTELRKAPGFYRRAIQLLLLTGMRRGELLGLEWKDVNWKDQSLRIMRTSQYLPERGVYTDETKNASSCRLIEVSAQVMIILQKQLMLFVLALLTLVSVIPMTAISASAAPAADIPAEMLDNYVLDAMEYLGYDIAGHKASGDIYVDIASSKTYKPPISYTGSLTGLEMVTDTSTPTGKAPNVASFQSSGLVCASYVTYYYLNYLPNIKGVDVSAFKAKMQAQKNATGLSWQGAWLWKHALDEIATDGSGVVTRLYKKSYKDTGAKIPDDIYATMQTGDIITFGTMDENGGEVFSHVGIYLGKYKSNSGTRHFISHMVSGGLLIGTVEGMYDTSNDKQSHVTGVYRTNLPYRDESGKIEVYKKDPNGNALAGAEFSVVNTADPTEVYKLGPTNSDGYAELKDIPYGTYKIVETVFPDGFTSDGTTEWTRTLNADTPNATITINAVNVPEDGVGKIIKTATNGGTVAGWLFTIKDSDGVVAENLKTDSDGVITTNLAPGTYTVTETGHKSMSAAKLAYWTMDSKSRTLTIKSGETSSVTFSNKYLGMLEIQKETNTGKNLPGWIFDVLNEDGEVVATVTTNGKGIATVSDLEPGTYTVREVGGPDGAWGSAAWFFDVTTSAGITTYSQNLLANASFSGTTDWRGLTGTAIAATTYDSKTCLSIDPSACTGNVGFGVQTVTNLTAGTYTISARIYSAMDQTIRLGRWDGSMTIIDSHAQIPVKAGWNDIQYTFKLAEDYEKLTIGFGAPKPGGTLYVYHPKLEHGSYATTWTDSYTGRVVTVSAGETAIHSVKNTLGGKIAVRKITNTEEYLSGWLFEVKDSDGKLIVTLVTDDSGYAVSEILAPGTYTVTEVGNSNPDWDPDLWDMDETVHTVTISENSYKEVQTVEFVNTFITLPGVARIVKTSTNGGTVAGWTFIIVDGSGTETEVVTDESGVIAVELEPGTYKVYEKPISDNYWVQDETVYEFTLQSEEVKELPFINRWIGGLEIVKTLLNPEDGTLDGWTFLIEKVVEVDGEITVESSFTAVTAENGLISQFIEPGTYRITEVLEENSLWEPTGDNPQTVEIIAGEKISVAFENRLKPGRIEIRKCDISGTPLAGAKFLLEWSEDGEVWTPVIFNDADFLVAGGCSSSDLIDGTLVTGEEGIIAFEGLHPQLQYRVTELEAPEGYQLLSDYAYVGLLPTDTVEIQRNVINFKHFTLPSVGSVGASEIIAGGMFLTVLALALCSALFVLSGKEAVKKKYFMKGKTNMKTNINRILSLLVVLCLTITLALPAFAAENAAAATIDTTKTGSITLNKYDMTAATADGVFETNSFVTTGTVDEAAESVLTEYAIQGVIFSYIKVADIVTYSANETGHKTMVLYAFDEGAATTQLLTALGLTAADAYNNVEGEAGKLYFVSDTLIAALAAKLASNSSILKNDLEAFMDDNNATAMPETDANGKSAVTGLDLGLYLLVESYVPENVSKTTAPFFVSVPSTTIDGDNWNYDITLYPKNETDAPNLEKTLRESKPDTGKHNGTTDDITDGYAHTGTASDGDVVDYQIISSLPKITSNATALTTYTFADTLSKGIEYNKNDVLIEWYTDAACTDLIATWTEADGKFAVVYGEGENNTTTMTIAMTDTGLDEINNSTAVYDADSLFRGYSDCTIRITYAATVNSSADVVYGDNGNPNEVTLTWKRTNTSYYDTLTDDCHVFVYALDLTKYFSDGNGDFAEVNFVIYNETDGYWVVAEQDAETGIYYVIDHVTKESDATVFIPTAEGKITVKGIEDDTYIITETATDDGYIMLKDAITVVITAAGDGEICTVCGKEGVTATATVDGDPVAMTEDNGSLSAVVNFSVVNERGYEIPQTGDAGTVMLIVWGILATVSALCIAIMVLCKRDNKYAK